MDEDVSLFFLRHPHLNYENDMKKLVFILFAALLCSQAAFAYDFSAVAPSGQTLYYNINGDGVAVTCPSNNFWGSYSKPVGDLIIPDSVTYSGITYAVTSIGDCAFYGCTGLTSVTIAPPITNIGTSAFEDCTGLTSVVFNADSCTYAGYYSNLDSWAFKGCTNITSFAFGDNVKNIPDYLCFKLTGLTSVSIGDSVTRIGNYAFKQCTGLQSVTIGNAVTYIGLEAFCFCSGLSSLTIGNSVTSIGYQAFFGCDSLTSIIFPNSVTIIANRAFQGCTGLTSVTFGDSLSTIGGEAFSGCTGLTSVTFGNSATIIGVEAFYYCSSLLSVTFGNSVTQIGTCAFDHCGSLTSVTIPNSVTYIGGGAFYECGSLTSVTIGNSVNNIDQQAFSRCRSLTSVIIPNSVRTIGERAFEDCSSLTSVTIGNSVTNIKSLAFAGCPILSSITFLKQSPPTMVNGFSSVFLDIPSNYMVYIPCGSLSRYSTIISSSHLHELSYGFSAVSADDSAGTVHILTEPSCTNHNAVISAVPADGYHFDHWSTGSTDNPYTLTVSSDTTITAFFVEEYTVTVLVDNPVMGSITGGGVFGDGSSVTITAYPAEGYRFDHWSTGSTDNPYTLTVTCDTAIVAYFEEIPTYTVNVITDNPARGSVTGGGVFEEGSSIALTATPANGYRFDHWSTGSTDNPYTLIVTSDTDIIAYFEEIPTYTVNVTSDNPASGSVTGGGVFEGGSSITISATPAEGYRFDHWSTGSTDNPYTLTVTSDTTIIAYFVSDGTQGIGEVGAGDIRISVFNGRVCVEGITNEEVRVYDITGRKVQNHALPSGVYIVKVGDLPAQKVVVMR